MLHNYYSMLRYFTTTYFYCIDQTKLARYLYIYVQMMSLHNQVNLKVTRMRAKPSTWYHAIIYTTIQIKQNILYSTD